MLSVIAGGRDVSRSAERAPFGLEFDRLAVGTITVANSPDGANEAGGFDSRSLTEIEVKPQVRVLLGCAFGVAKGGPAGTGRSDGEERPAADRDAGHMPTCALTPRDVVAVGTYSPWSVSHPNLEPMARRAGA